MRWILISLIRVLIVGVFLYAGLALLGGGYIYLGSISCVVAILFFFVSANNPDYFYRKLCGYCVYAAVGIGCLGFSGVVRAEWGEPDAAQWLKLLYAVNEAPWWVFVGLLVAAGFFAFMDYRLNSVARAEVLDSDTASGRFVFAISRLNVYRDPISRTYRARGIASVHNFTEQTAQLTGISFRRGYIGFSIDGVLSFTEGSSDVPGENGILDIPPTAAEATKVSVEVEFRNRIREFLVSRNRAVFGLLVRLYDRIHHSGLLTVDANQSWAGSKVPVSISYRATAATRD